MTQDFEPTPGKWYDDLPADVYHAAPGFSSTQLKRFYQWSPLHFRHAPPKKDTKALMEGRLLHTMVLEPHKVDDEFTFPDEWEGCKKPRANKLPENYTDEEKLWVDRMADIEGGLKTVIQGNRLQHQRIADAIHAHPLWKSQLGPEPIIERSFWWTDEKTGLLLKFRADTINPLWGQRINPGANLDRGLICDLKSSRDPRPEKFSKDVVDLGYDFSAAMYQEGARQMLGMPVDFCWFVFEKEPPYGVTVTFPDSKVRRRGQNYFRHTLDRLALCIKHDRWPGIGNGRPVIVSRPGWAPENPEENE